VYVIGAAMRPGNTGSKGSCVPPGVVSVAVGCAGGGAAPVAVAGGERVAAWGGDVAAQAHASVLAGMPSAMPSVPAGGGKGAVAADPWAGRDPEAALVDGADAEGALAVATATAAAAAAAATARRASKRPANPVGGKPALEASKFSSTAANLERRFVAPEMRRKCFCAWEATCVGVLDGT
jgi:hypothetical protein